MTGREVRALLTEFGVGAGAGDLVFDESGFCRLAVDEVILTLEMNEEAETLSMYAPAGEIPAGAGRGVREKLLSANYLFRGAAGATLGADPATGQVVLFYSLPFAAVTRVKFERVVENFVNVVESWTRQTLEAASAPVVSTTPAGQFLGVKA